jgi:hypothetical protein
MKRESKEAVGEMFLLLALDEIDLDGARGVLEDLFAERLITLKESKSLQGLLSQLEAG